MFQVSSIVVRQSYTLQSVHPNISSTHLTPYIVITILLTIFPMLYLTSPCLFCNYQSVRLHSFTTLHLSFSRFILPGEKTLQPTHFTYIQQCQTFSHNFMNQLGCSGQCSHPVRAEELRSLVSQRLARSTCSCTAKVAPHPRRRLSARG